MILLEDFAWWVAKWWVAVLFGGIVALAKFLWNKHKKNKEAEEEKEREWRMLLNERDKEMMELLRLHSKAMISILYDRLNQAYCFFSNRGYTTAQDRHNCLKMFTIYHDLGGNDNMEDIMEKLKELPVKQAN